MVSETSPGDAKRSRRLWLVNAVGVTVLLAVAFITVHRGYLEHAVEAWTAVVLPLNNSDNGSAEEPAAVTVVFDGVADPAAPALSEGHAQARAVGSDMPAIE